MNKPLAVLVGIVLAIVTVIMVGTVAGDFFASVSDINTGIENGTYSTGSTSADNILGIFPLVIGVGAAVGIVGLILAAVSLKGRK